MSLHIQKLPVPELLVQMIEDKSWFKPSHIHRIRELMKGISKTASIDLLPLSEIQKETLAIKKLFYEYDRADEYGLYSSKQSEKSNPDSSFIDVEKCLIIIATIFEDGIFLDYRNNPSLPEVVATECINNTYFRHYKVADSFEEFVKMAW